MSFLSSAFKNFFITFAICLLVFGFIGLQFIYPWLSNIVNFDDMNDTSSDVSTDDISGDTSEDTTSNVTPPKNDFDENGDVFTALIMCVDSQNRPLSCVFIDSNAKTKNFIYCPIGTSIRVENEIGVPVPVGDLFRTMSPVNVAQTMSAMTGIETKYCLRFDREDIKAIAAMIPGASVTLSEDIVIINPEYEDYIPVDGEYPDDYYITITNVDGKVLLNEELNDKTKLEWLLEYNPNHDGSEYNAIYTQISKALLKQFLNNESSLKSTKVMAELIKNCETNLTLDSATGHLDTIFSYNKFQYNETTYPSSWENAVSKLRELDGSYNKK